MTLLNLQKMPKNLIKWESQISTLKIDFEKVAEGIKNTTGKIRGVITSETKKAGVNIVIWQC